jgi:hypothetical protein
MYVLQPISSFPHTNHHTGQDAFQNNSGLRRYLPPSLDWVVVQVLWRAVRVPNANPRSEPCQGRYIPP